MFKRTINLKCIEEIKKLRPRNYSFINLTSNYYIQFWALSYNDNTVEEMGKVVPKKKGMDFADINIRQAALYEVRKGEQSKGTLKFVS